MPLNFNQLDAAVKCYLYMRGAVHALGISPAPAKFLSGAPFINVTLKDTANHHFAAHDLWDLCWDKPFYSGMRTAIASQRVSDALAGGWFNSYTTFVDANADPAHPWYVIKNGMTCTATGAEAVDFCSKSGSFTSMKYRTGAKVIHRINKIADFIDNLTKAAAKSGSSVVNELAGGNAFAPVAVTKAHAKLAKVTGSATAYHILSDLGFPCFKPDIWMTRIADWCSWANDLNANNPCTGNSGSQLLAAGQDIVNHAVKNYGVKDLNPLRAFDFYVAQYGMNFKPQGCPCCCDAPGHHSGQVDKNPSTPEEDTEVKDGIENFETEYDNEDEDKDSSTAS